MSRSPVNITLVTSVHSRHAAALASQVSEQSERDLTTVKPNRIRLLGTAETRRRHARVRAAAAAAQRYCVLVAASAR